MSSETEFVVKDSGLSADSIDAGEMEVWLEVLHGSDAGNRIKASYRNASAEVREVMDTVESGDVVTVELVDDLGSWKIVGVEELDS